MGATAPSGAPAFVASDSFAGMRLRVDRRQAVVLLWVIFAGVVVLAAMDVRVLGWDAGRTAALLVFRLAWAATTYACIRAIRDADDRESLDRRTMSAVLFTCTAMVLLAVLRPPDNYSLNRLEIVAIFFGLTGFSLPVRRIAPLIGAYTAACILVLIFYNVGVSSFERDSIIVAFAVANITGYIVASRREKLLASATDVWRENTEVHHALTGAHAQLAKTHAELRTLRGILPICSFCHRIRAEEGDWKRLEQYVSLHSEAEFSHGVCPECVTKHYPELATPMPDPVDDASRAGPR